MTSSDSKQSLKNVWPLIPSSNTPALVRIDNTNVRIIAVVLKISDDVGVVMLASQGLGTTPFVMWKYSSGWNV